MEPRLRRVFQGSATGRRRGGNLPSTHSQCQQGERAPNRDRLRLRRRKARPIRHYAPPGARERDDERPGRQLPIALGLLVGQSPVGRFHGSPIARDVRRPVRFHPTTGAAHAAFGHEDPEISAFVGVDRRVGTDGAEDVENRPVARRRTRSNRDRRGRRRTGHHGDRGIARLAVGLGSASDGRQRDCGEHRIELALPEMSDREQSRLASPEALTSTLASGREGGI